MSFPKDDEELSSLSWVSESHPMLNDLESLPTKPERFTSITYLGNSKRKNKLSSARIYVVSFFLCVSLLWNLGLTFRLRSCQIPFRSQSQYAGIVNDLSIPFEWATDYATTNLTLAAELWDSISFDAGFVALPDEFTKAKNLPHAQRFPWDKSQGLYVLNGYHALHCLKNIHMAIRQYELGEPQTLPLMHITHCLDSLRGDILCQADDTPRYTTITKSPESAVGQIRQCRDWNRLEDWAKQHTSCYNYISSEADHINQFERFKFCPPGSPYWPRVREHFGKGPDWTPVSGVDIITE